MHSPGLIIGGLICAAIGSGLGWFASSLRRKTTIFLARANRVQGTVVELVRVSGSEGDTFAPKYVFCDNEGREKTVVAKSSSSPPKYSVGQQIGVLLEVESGETRLDDWLDLRGPEIILAVLALATLVAGAICFALYFSN